MAVSWSVHTGTKYRAGTDLHHIRLSLCDDYLIGHAILLVECGPE